jgi:NAD(P)-dependent dehydrogenase (short-subunit alcohol dehydrogenase family)
MAALSEKVALITGGTGGLGQAVVPIFAEAGARLVLPDRRQGRLAKRFPALAESSRHRLLDNCDITQPEQMNAAVEAALASFGRIDVLVHTVGGYTAGKLPHETSLETWDRMQALNARTTFSANQAVIPAMLAQQAGRILNIAARPALAAGARDVAYSASKSAVARITESIAKAYQRDGIRANALLPGTIDTPANRQALPEADFSRWIQPQDLAQLLVFLASEQGAVVNGALIPVTGKK